MDIASASIIITSGLAIITAYLAWRQYRNDRLKVMLDLYDRRYATYEAIMQFVSAIVGDATTTLPELLEFNRARSTGYFLFGDEVSEYMKVLYDKGIELSQMHERLSDPGLDIGEERSRLSSSKGELLKWFGDQYDVARNKFAKYLSLAEVQSKFAGPQFRKRLSPKRG